MQAVILVNGTELFTSILKVGGFMHVQLQLFYEGFLMLLFQAIHMVSSQITLWTCTVWNMHISDTILPQELFEESTVTKI